MSFRALVVGGTGGIGFAIASRLAAAEAGSIITISGRNKPQNIPHTNMEFRALDATSMRQIKSYTESFKAERPQKLDMLVMTQGIMTMAGRTETPEGIDRKMALHYYGKQLLIRELLPSLKDDARVVIVLDSIYSNPAKLNWDDLDLKTHFSLGAAAQHCTLMNDAMIQYFAAEQKKAGSAKRQFIHAWPGGVRTSLLRDLPWYIRGLANAVGNLITVSPEECATYMTDGVARAAAEDSKAGQYYSYIDNKGRPVPKKKIWSEDEQNKIARHTWELVDSGINKSS